MDTTASHVHVIDDDAPAREALVDLLMRNGYFASAYASAEAFLGRAEGLPNSGCVISDVNMPDMSGLDLLRALKAEAVDLPVLMLTGAADVGMAVEALKGGAAEFIEKPVRSDVLLPALAAVVADQSAKLDRIRARQEAADRLASLSPREAEVLAQVVSGDSNKEIARDLSLSPRTVEAYRAKVMLKLDADSLPDLVQKTIHLKRDDPAG